jgi:hypothetical protein
MYQLSKSNTEKTIVNTKKFNIGGEKNMATKMPPTKVWKQTTHLITHEPIDVVVKEIEEETSWTAESIRTTLFDRKLLIMVESARYHIYRDSLG